MSIHQHQLMSGDSPYIPPGKGKNENGYQLFLMENSDKLPEMDTVNKIQYMNRFYNSLPNQEKNSYSARASSQSQVQTTPSRKKKKIEGNQSGYISQNSNNFPQQEPQHFSSVSPKVNYNLNPNSHNQINNNNSQISSSPQIANNPQNANNRQFNHPYQIVSSISSFNSIHTKPNQVQPVTPKKLFTKEIRRTQESEPSDSADDSDSNSFNSSSSSHQQALVVKIPSKYGKQVQNSNQTQNQNQGQNQMQPNFYPYKQAQVKQNFPNQQPPKSKQKPQKIAPVLVTPPYQGLPISEHRPKYDQNEPKRLPNVNINTNAAQNSFNADPYSLNQPHSNQMYAQRQPDRKYYQFAESMFSDEILTPTKEEERARNLMNEFELNSNYCFSMTPFDCNCLDNYSISFVGK